MGVLLLALLLIAAQLIDISRGFAPSHYITRCFNNKRVTILNVVDEEFERNIEPSEPERIMEEASREGYERIRNMSIAERTKRAMLAEVIEDRIFSMYDDLEGLVAKDGSVEKENRDKVTELAIQIKASQKQYRTLVTGEPSSMLDMMEGDRE
mmetsp:Transcript_21957/g.27169  ORF Transcript_21957/g.27169 Transcript_21957/m.27169 type:complete len:153 (+) Transcript_21957:118-576(+)